MIRNTGAVLYGTITVGALLAAESAKHETYGRTVGAVAITMMLYWLVHAYSGFTEERVERNQPFALSALGRTLAQELMIIGGAAMPLLALLICWAAGAALGDAVNVAVWTSAAMILIVEVLAGVRAGLSGQDLVAHAAFGASFGLLVVIVNVLLR